jgi:hypothetical protein
MHDLQSDITRSYANPKSAKNATLETYTTAKKDKERKRARALKWIR